MACLETSADGIFCKQHNGRRVLLDFGVNAFDALKWKSVSGHPLPVHDLVNGWLKVGGDVGLGVSMIYDDSLLPEVDALFVAAEVYAEDSSGYLPGVIAQVKAGDGDNFNYAMKHGVTPQRMLVGRRVGGVDGGPLPVVGTVEGAFYWMSVGVTPDDPNTRRYGSDNDQNWPMQEFSTHLFERTGKGGIRFWRIGAQTDEARVRKYAEYYGDVTNTTPFQIAFLNVPTGHRIHIERDVDGEKGTLDNTSGSDATMTFDCIGFPVPLNVEKRIPPWDRCYLTTIADPATKLGEFIPSIGVNWGDVYDVDELGGFGAGCPPVDEGAAVLFGDCDEGLDVVYGDCQDGSANKVCP